MAVEGPDELLRQVSKPSSALQEQVKGWHDIGQLAPEQVQACSSRHLSDALAHAFSSKLMEKDSATQKNVFHLIDRCSIEQTQYLLKNSFLQIVMVFLKNTIDSQEAVLHGLMALRTIFHRIDITTLNEPELLGSSLLEYLFESLQLYASNPNVQTSGLAVLKLCVEAPHLKHEAFHGRTLDLVLTAMAKFCDTPELCTTGCDILYLFAYELEHDQQHQRLAMYLERVIAVVAQTLKQNLPENDSLVLSALCTLNRLTFDDRGCLVIVSMGIFDRVFEILLQTEEIAMEAVNLLWDLLTCPAVIKRLEASLRQQEEQSEKFLEHMATAKQVFEKYDDLDAEVRMKGKIVRSKLKYVMRLAKKRPVVEPSVPEMRRNSSEEGVHALESLREENKKLKQQLDQQKLQFQNIINDNTKTYEHNMKELREELEATRQACDAQMILSKRRPSLNDIDREVTELTVANELYQRKAEKTKEDLETMTLLVNERTKELTEAKAQVFKLQRDNASARSNCEAYSHQLDMMKALVAEQDEKLKSGQLLNASEAVSKDDYDKVEKMLKQLQQDNESLHQQVDQSRQKVEDLQKRNSEIIRERHNSVDNTAIDRDFGSDKWLVTPEDLLQLENTYQEERLSSDRLCPSCLQENTVAHQQLHHEITRLEALVTDYENDMMTIKKELTHAQEENISLKASTDDAHSKSQQQEDKIATHEAEIEALKQQHLDMQHEAQTKLQRFEHDLSESQNQSLSFQEQIKTAKKEHEAQLEELQTRVREYDESNSTQVKALKEMKHAMEKLQQQKRKVEQDDSTRIKDHEVDMKALRDQIADLEDEKLKYQDEILQLKTKTSELETQKEQIHASQKEFEESLRSGLERLELANAEYEQQLENSQQELTLLRSEAQQMHSVIAEAETCSQAQLKTIEELNQSTEDLKKERDESRESHNSLVLSLRNEITRLEQHQEKLESNQLVIDETKSTVVAKEATIASLQQAIAQISERNDQSEKEVARLHEAQSQSLSEMDILKNRIKEYESSEEEQLNRIQILEKTKVRLEEEADEAETSHDELVNELQSHIEQMKKAEMEYQHQLEIFYHQHQQQDLELASLRDSKEESEKKTRHLTEEAAELEERHENVVTDLRKEIERLEKNIEEQQEHLKLVEQLHEHQEYADDREVSFASRIAETARKLKEYKEAAEFFEQEKLQAESQMNEAHRMHSLEVDKYKQAEAQHTKLTAELSQLNSELTESAEKAQEQHRLELLKLSEENEALKQQSECEVVRLRERGEALEIENTRLEQEFTKEEEAHARLVTDLRKEMESLRQSVTEHQDQLQSLQQDHKKLSSDHDLLGEEKEKVVSTKESLEKELRDEIERLSNSAQVLEEEAINEQEKLQQIQLQAEKKEEELKSEIAEIEVRLKISEEARATHVTSIEDLQKRKSELESHQHENHVQQEQVVIALKEQVAKLESCVAEHDKQVQTLTTEKHTLEIKFASLKHEKEEVISTYSEQQTRFQEKANEEQSTLKLQVEELSTRVEESMLEKEAYLNKSKEMLTTRKELKESQARLKERAEKVEKVHETLVHDLRDEIKRLRQSVTDHQERSQALQEEHERLASEHSVLGEEKEQAISAQVSLVNELRDEISRLRDSVTEYQNEVQTQKQELMKAQEETELIQSKAVKKEEELLGEIAIMKAKMTASEDASATQWSSFHALQEQKLQVEKQLAENTKTHEQVVFVLQEDIAKLKSSYTESEEHVKEAQAVQQHFEAQIASLNAEKTQMARLNEESISAARKEIQSLEKQSEVATLAQEHVHEEHSRLELLVEEFRSKFSTLDEQKAAQTQQILHLQKENEQLAVSKAHLQDHAKKVAESHETLVDDLRREIQRLNESVTEHQEQIQSLQQDQERIGEEKEQAIAGRETLVQDLRADIERLGDSVTKYQDKIQVQEEELMKAQEATELAKDEIIKIKEAATWESEQMKLRLCQSEEANATHFSRLQDLQKQNAKIQKQLDENKIESEQQVVALTKDKATLESCRRANAQELATLSTEREELQSLFNDKEQQLSLQAAIVSELRGQIQGLKEHVIEQEQEAAQCKEKTREIQARFELQVEELTSKVYALNEQKEAQLQQLLQSKVMAETHENLLHELRNELQLLCQSVREYQDRIQALEGDHQRLASDHDIVINEKEQAISTHQSLVQELREEIKQYQNEIESLNAEKLTGQQQNAELLEKMDAMTIESKAYEEQVLALRAGVEAKHIEKEALDKCFEEQRVAYEEQLGFIREQGRELEAECSAYKEDKDLLRSTYESLEKELRQEIHSLQEQSRKNREDAIDVQERSSQEQTSLHLQLEEVFMKLHAAKELIATKDSDKETLRAFTETLTQEIDSLKKDIADNQEKFSQALENLRESEAKVVKAQAELDATVESTEKEKSLLVEQAETTKLAHGSLVKGLRTQIEDGHEEISQLKANHERLELEHKNLVEEKAKTASESENVILKLRKELLEKDQTLAAAESEVKKLNDESSLLGEREEALKAQLQALQTSEQQLAESKSMLQEQAERVAIMNAEIVNDFQMQLEQAEAALRCRQEAIHQHEWEEQKAKAQAEEAQAQLTRLSTRAEEAALVQEAQQMKIADLEALLRGLQEEKTVLENTKVEHTVKIMQLEEVVDKKQANVCGLEQKLKEQLSLYELLQQEKLTEVAAQETHVKELQENMESKLEQQEFAHKAEAQAQKQAFHVQVNELAEKLEALRETNEKAQEEIAQLAEDGSLKKKEYNAQVDGFQKEIMRLGNSIIEHQENFATKLTEHRESCESYQQRIEELQQQRQALQQQLEEDRSLHAKELVELHSQADKELRHKTQQEAQIIRLKDDHNVLQTQYNGIVQEKKEALLSADAREQELRKEIRELEHLNSSFRVELEKHKEEVAQAHRQEEKAKQLEMEYESKLKASTRDRAASLEKLQVVENTVQVLEAAAENSTAEHTAEVQELRSQMEKYSNKVTSLELEKSSQQQHYSTLLEEAEKQASALQSKLREYEQSTEMHLRKIKKLSKKKEALETSEFTLRHKTKQAELAKQKLQDSISHYEQEVEALKQEYQVLQTKQQAMVKDMSHLTNAVVDSNLEITRLQDSYDEVQADREALTEQKEQLASMHKALVQELKKEMDTLRYYNGENLIEIQALKQARDKLEQKRSEAAENAAMEKAALQSELKEIQSELQLLQAEHELREVEVKELRAEKEKIGSQKTDVQSTQHRLLEIQNQELKNQRSRNKQLTLQLEDQQQLLAQWSFVITEQSCRIREYKEICSMTTEDINCCVPSTEFPPEYQAMHSYGQYRSHGFKSPRSSALTKPKSMPQFITKGFDKVEHLCEWASTHSLRSKSPSDPLKTFTTIRDMLPILSRESKTLGPIYEHYCRPKQAKKQLPKDHLELGGRLAISNLLHFAMDFELLPFLIDRKSLVDILTRVLHLLREYRCHFTLESDAKLARMGFYFILAFIARHFEQKCSNKNQRLTPAEQIVATLQWMDNSRGRLKMTRAIGSPVLPKFSIHLHQFSLPLSFLTPESLR